MLFFSDICWPATLLYGNHVVAVLAIILGFAVEASFVHSIYEKPIKETLWITFSMNLWSAVAGIPLSFVNGAFLAVPLGFLLSPAALNAAIECYVLKKCLELPMNRTIFGWILLANVISVGMSMMSFF